MAEDAPWYEAAFVTGITNALNVVADGLAEVLPPLDDATAGDATAVFAEIRAFHGGLVPAPFGVLARDPAYLADVWAAWRRAFSDQRLTRRLKTALAFAVSLTTRSSFGTQFHLAEVRGLRAGERDVIEVIGLTHVIPSFTKIADTLQLDSDMGAIAPVDRSPAPGH